MSGQTQASLYFSQPVNYSYIDPFKQEAKCVFRDFLNGTCMQYKYDPVVVSVTNALVMNLPSGADATVSWVGAHGELLGRSYSEVSAKLSQTTSVVESFSLGLKDLAGQVDTGEIRVPVVDKNIGINYEFCLGCYQFFSAETSQKLDSSELSPVFNTVRFGFENSPDFDVRPIDIIGGPVAPDGTLNEPLYLTSSNIDLMDPPPDTETTVNVPEPGSLWLLMSGLLACTGVRRRRALR